jgi:hypothetical protein
VDEKDPLSTRSLKTKGENAYVVQFFVLYAMVESSMTNDDLSADCKHVFAAMMSPEGRNLYNARSSSTNPKWKNGINEETGQLWKVIKSCLETQPTIQEVGSLDEIVPVLSAQYVVSEMFGIPVNAAITSLPADIRNYAFARSNALGLQL